MVGAVHDKEIEVCAQGIECSPIGRYQRWLPLFCSALNAVRCVLVGAQFGFVNPQREEDNRMPLMKEEGKEGALEKETITT